jgi:hypothetical protein
LFADASRRRASVTLADAIYLARAEHRCDGAADDDPNGSPAPQSAGADVASALS